jgi:hypothetical protein
MRWESPLLHRGATAAAAAAASSIISYPLYGIPIIAFLLYHID